MQDRYEVGRGQVFQQDRYEVGWGQVFQQDQYEVGRGQVFQQDRYEVGLSPGSNRAHKCMEDYLQIQGEPF